MKRARLALVLGLFALPACSRAPAPASTPADDGTSLARVDGVPITDSTLQELAREYRRRHAGELSEQDKQELLTKAITDELLYAEALRRELHKDPKVREILTNMLVRQQLAGAVAADVATEDKLKAHYEAHPERFVLPEKRRIRRIFLPVGESGAEGDDAAKARADDLHARIAADPDAFAALATEHSAGPFAVRGGDVGLVSDDNSVGLPEQVLQGAFEADVDALPAPVFAGGGWNLYRVEDVRPRTVRTYEQSRMRIKRELEAEAYKTALAAWIDELEANASVQRYEDRLQGWQPTPAAPVPHPGEQASPKEEPATPNTDEGDVNDQVRALMEKDDGQ